MDLIESLRLYRLEHQLTQQELARKLSVSFATVNRWFKEKTRPSELQAYRIKKLTGHPKNAKAHAKH